MSHSIPQEIPGSEAGIEKNRFFVSILAISGLACALVFFTFIFQPNQPLFLGILCLLAVYGLSYVLYRFIRPTVGHHAYILGTISVYIGLLYFTDLTYYSALLLFPIITLIAINLFQEILTSVLYFLYCSVPLVQSLVKYYDGVSVEDGRILIEVTISITFFAAFFYVGARLLNGWRMSHQKIDESRRRLRVKQARIERQNQELLVKNTELLEAEQRITKKNMELEKYIESNMQLENFAYIASHDLQAPLTGIIGFTDMLSESAREKLDPNEQKFLQIIRDRAGNMQNLIRDLLEFSRADSTKIQFGEVNSQGLFGSLMNDVSIYLREKNALVNINNNLPPAIVVDQIKLKQLFQNLITNGVKFSRPGIPPRVEVTADIGPEGNYLFSFRDNGIGISQENQEKIFGMFQRLHTQKEYHGTGIGLALVKKLVEQHNGQIWLESEVGKGSTFHVSLPARRTSALAS